VTRRSSSSARTWSRWSSRAIAIALGIALPTVLLGLGWLAASLRERETLAREQRLLLTRSADAIRGAIDESLEEMRRREDGRPFYLYNHFYSPPEVIAINDPVAVSPLASEPTDPRIVGHFQIDPGGAVRTPYEIEPGSKGSRRALAVTSRVSSPGLGPLRALAVRSPDAPSSSSPSSLVAGGEIAAPADAGSPVVPPRRVVRRARIASTRDRDAGQASSAQASLTPQGPLTVTPSGRSVSCIAVSTSSLRSTPLSGVAEWIW